MDLFGRTEGEKLIELMEQQAPNTSAIIQWYIDHHDTAEMDEGVRYYYNDSDIQRRRMYKYENERKVIDEDATNNKISTGWHKTLVDQKVAYLAGKPVSINSKNDDSSIEDINDILGDEFDDSLPELVKNASNRGKDWLHVFLDEEGQFDTMIVPATEFIPIYDNTKRKRLIGGIRHYMLDDETEKAEVWDRDTVTYYEKANGKWVVDVNYKENPEPHFYYGDQGYGWSTEKKVAIPFIEFRNNEEAIGDLTFYKDLIDAFERVISDETNTLEDVQNFIYVLKNYEGTNLEEFMNNLKKYKAIKTGEDGGVDTLNADIPTEANKQYLEEIRDLIYQAGQGVNHSTDKFGNSPSGVALKFLYSLLDMKANVMERKFTKALKNLMWFVCEYLNIVNNSDLDYKDYTFTFNKSMITNEYEQAQIAQISKGIISDETVVANHPWVTDPELEKQRMEEQKSAYPSLGDANEEPTGT